MAARILSNLPNELWAQLVAIVSTCSLRDALSFNQTCSRLLSSYPGQRIRYMAALALDGLPVPSILAEPKSNLSYEATLLFNRWPFASPRTLLSIQDDEFSSGSTTEVRFLGRPQLFGQTLIDLSQSRNEILICQISPNGSTEEIKITQVINSLHPEWGTIRELSVDIDSGTFGLVYGWETMLKFELEEEETSQVLIEPLQVQEQRGIISLQVFSLLTGNPISSPYHHVLERDESTNIPSFSSLDVSSSSSSPPSTFSSPLSVVRTFLSAELNGSKILLAAQGKVLVFSWSLKRWKCVFSREIEKDSDGSVRLDLLSASFFPSNQVSSLVPDFSKLDPHCLVVMSSPTTSLHGKDWGSELEFYKLPSQSSGRRQEKIFTSESEIYFPSLKNEYQEDEKGQLPDVSISLPIRSKVKPAAGRGLNYIKTGDSKRERFGDNDDFGKGKGREVGDSLVVICVEGFIWLATLSSFLEVLYPVSALALFGEDPTLRLGTEWVRGNLTRCSLSAADTAPVTPVSVSGWRLAVPWSRSPFAQQRGPRTQSGGPSAAFIRFLDASPRYRDKKKIKDMLGKIHVNTMWWSENERYIVYFDHALDYYLPTSTASLCDILLTFEGARIICSVPNDTQSGKSKASLISVATV